MKKLVESINGNFLNGVHRMVVRAYYQDIDAAGIVYHARYLHFAERARHEMNLGILKSLGNDSDIQKFLEIGDWALVDVCLKYKKPAKLYDTILIETSVFSIDNLRFKIKQNLFKVVDGKKEILLCEINPTLVFVKKNLRPSRVPLEWKNAISKFLIEKT